MQIQIFENEIILAEKVSAALAELIIKKPEAVICMASGGSPKLTCTHFVNLVRKINLDTSKFFFVGLDEWVGISPEMVGSCANDFQERIFTPLQINETQYHLFNALSNDPPGECLRMEEVIQAKGGIDLMIVGIGMNGHIGFNEPGVDFNNRSHIATLASNTVQVGQKYFQTATQLSRGLTLGLANLKESSKVILIATGVSKAAIVKKAFQETVNSNVPASFMQTLDHAFIFLDQEAASDLSR
jgi:glucosamine-6-phosphate isomerase